MDEAFLSSSSRGLVPVREIDGQREGVHLRWGLIPYWARGKPMGNTINARIETVRTNSTFRDAWQRGQRCGLSRWALTRV